MIVRCRGVRPVLAVLGLGLLLPGCVIVQPRVVNPLPNVTRVAIVPFVNQSTEPAVDVLLVTRAYYAELQAVPGFEVVPVGVTARKIETLGLRMTGPEAALELARVLDVDAVVLGAITDYDPYDPPRIAWHVEWYSPHPPTFAPGVPVDPYVRPDLFRHIRDGWLEESPEDCEVECPDDGSFEAGPRSTAGRSRAGRVVRGQSPTVSVFELVPPEQRPRVYGPRLIRPSDVRPVEGDDPSGNANEEPAEPGDVESEVRESPFYTRDELWWDDEETDGSGVPRIATGDDVPPALLDESAPGTPEGATRPVPMPVPIEDVEPSPPLDPAPDSTGRFEELRPPRAPFGPGPGEVVPTGPAIEPPSRDGVPEPIEGSPYPRPIESVPVLPTPPNGFEPEAVPFGHSGGPTIVVPERPPVPPFDPQRPIMAYTRVFDGRDADLHARLRDYYELNGDERAGGWRGYLQRSEDFVRFTAHVTIAEMLTLHGGETKRRYVWKVRRRS